MKIIDKLIYKTDSKEELLPGYSERFPYISSRVELDKYPEHYVPWHWHNALELFYIESGTLEYFTPEGSKLFEEGTGGLVNSNVLHMTRLQPDISNNIQLLHLFDPIFISGAKGNLIDRKYVMPFVSDSQIEIVSLLPDTTEQKEILKLIRETFQLDENEKGYELRLRERLSEIWLKIMELAEEQTKEKKAYRKSNDRIKGMMIYIQEHYFEKITVTQLADIAYLSERECYRVFQECLHMTPNDYMRNYRLQMACQMLIKEDMKLTEISHACGLGTGSYFGKIFKESIGCTPLEYRQKWQNCDIYRQY